VLAQPVLRFVERHPAEFYAGFYVVTFQMSVLFFDVLNTGSQVVHGMKAIDHWARPRMTPLGLQAAIVAGSLTLILVGGSWVTYSVLKLRPVRRSRAEIDDAAPA